MYFIMYYRRNTYQLSKTASFTEGSSLFASIFSPSSNSPLIASVSEMGQPASSLKRSANRRRRSRCTGARRKLRGRLAIFLGVINLLSAPLTIPLVCCHINHFRRAARCGEAMARRRKEDQWAGLASRGMCSDGVVAPTVWCLLGATPRGHGRAADGSVVYVSRALSGSPRAPRINAQRIAQSDPYNSHNCLLPKKLRREIQ